MNLNVQNHDPKSVQRNLLLNRLQAAQYLDATGITPWTIQSNLAYGIISNPCITVMISLFNYRSYIIECLQSIVDSEQEKLPGKIEILVIDDFSTDGSPALVETYLNQVDFPICLIKKTLNTGSADTRNIGLRLARAPYVFLLDADNYIFPSCLHKLLEVLAGSKYAAVYPMIQQFDYKTRASLGLLSKYEWDVRHLLLRPYLKAAALLNKELVLAVGGYSTELVEYGWLGFEEYDLWLKLAQANYECKLVQQVLCTHRVHPNSLTRFNAIYNFSIYNYFGLKFAELISRYPDLEMLFEYEFEYEGFVDHLNSSCISGWVWNKNQQHQPIEVEIYANEQLLTRILANTFRQDLYDNNKGLGYCSFLYFFPESIKKQQSLTLQVKIAGKDKEVAFWDNIPKVLDFSNPVNRAVVD